MKKLKVCNHRRRHACCATAIVISAIVLTLAVNVGAVMLENTFYLRADISKEQYTALTETSKELVSNLDTPIYLYYVGSDRQGDTRVTELLKRYAAQSANVHFKAVLPKSHAGFIQLYDPEEAGIEPGSVIVSDSDGFAGEAPARYQVLSPDDLYYLSTPYYGATGDLVSNVVSFRAEQRITSAIEHVVSNSSLSIVFLTGKGGANPPEALRDDLETMFFDIRSFDIDTPLDPLTQTLVAIGPKRDMNGAEFQAVSAFLEAGGRAIFLMNNVFKKDSCVLFLQESMPYINALLAGYGISVERNVIVGGDPSQTYMSRTSLIPELNEQSAATQPLSAAGLRPVLSLTSALSVTPAAGISVEVLLRTDGTSYAKALTAGGLDTYSRETADKSGPFVLGVIARKGKSSIAVFGTSSFVATEENYANAGNARLFLNTLSCLNNRMETTQFKARTVYSAYDPAYRLDISRDIEKALYILLAAGVLPATVLAIGIIRCIKRRRLH